MREGLVRNLALLVDDSPEVLDVGCRMLEASGYEVVTAGDFQRARDVLRSEEVRLLVTDVRLREFNGLQLAIEASLRRGIHIVIITGWADPSLRGEADGIGATLCTKPFTYESLKQAIDAAAKLP